MLPTAEGGKANAWLRQKSAGIYVRPRLFSPYVEEAKSVLDEMMVEQTDLVRLRMVRMSNVPDTLYMVNNAVPQCCHMINHQQISGSQAVPPSVVANEIPVPKLSVVREMIRRLQELRHTDQFGLTPGDGAAELLQNPHKFFPEERFGDESPVLALRQAGRCRVNSTPAVESMYTDVDALASFHPPLPPAPSTLPPAHHAQPRPAEGGLEAPAPSQPPSRSFSYPCNHTLLQRHPSSKHSSPAYPPDCTNPQGGGRTLHPDKQGNMEPVINEFMPDIAMGVSAMSLKERRMAEAASDGEGRDLHSIALTTGPAPHYPTGPCPPAGTATPPARSTQRKPSPRPGPSILTCTTSPAAPPRRAPPPLQGPYAGPDLYSHSRPPAGPHPPSYAPDAHPRATPLRPTGRRPAPGHAGAAPSAWTWRWPRRGRAAGGSGGGHVPRGRSATSRTSRAAWGPPLPARAWALRGPPPCSQAHPEGIGGGGSPGGLLPHRNSAGEEAVASRDRRSPNKPEYPYKKSAL
ncbi:hypothetical protein ANANG_G00021880 [Anguilla anguilla]|uniref:Uncharacterized protein n=1 Tax=Anguilla anguilla TaxID=7936 RepID=A0A9D3MYY9_ANGAN|nr:hypothetical protein ANANG_G00021880 [Anguilla anguilla]